MYLKIDTSEPWRENLKYHSKIGELEREKEARF